MLQEQEKYYNTILEDIGDKDYLEKIKEKLESHVELYEKAMAQIADPTEASPKIVFDYFVSCWRLWTVDKMNPEHYLIALDSLEVWYMVQGVEYPYPKRLEEQRTYWKERIDES